MSPSPEPSGAGKRSVLVVDDEPTLRLGFAYALTDPATTVESVGSGTEALDRLATQSYDLIVLDLRMPGMDGMAVIEALRKSDNLVPVILCSSGLNPRIIERCIRQGVVDFLLKPVLPSDLRVAAARMLTPGRFPHPDFWQAARSRDCTRAILLLEREKHLEPRMKAWWTFLRALTVSSEEGTLSPSDITVARALALLPWNA